MSECLEGVNQGCSAMRFRLLTIVAVAASSVIADDTLDDAAAIKKIELLGGQVTRDETLPGNPVVEIDFRESKRLRDGHLHLLRTFTNLTSLNLCNPRLPSCGHMREESPHIRDHKTLFTKAA